MGKTSATLKLTVFIECVGLIYGLYFENYRGLRFQGLRSVFSRSVFSGHCYLRHAIHLMYGAAA